MVHFTNIAAALMLTMTVAARPQVAETILPAAGQPVDCDCTKFDENGVQVVDDDGVRAGCAAVGAEFGTLNTREDGGLDDDQSQNLVCTVIEDGTADHDRAWTFVDHCGLHADCGWVGK